MVDLIISFISIKEPRGKVEYASRDKNVVRAIIKQHPLILLLGEPLESYQRMKRAHCEGEEFKTRSVAAIQRES